MDYQIGSCSPEATARIITFIDNVGTSTEVSARTKYPFSALTIGRAFIVPFADVSEPVLRTAASTHARLQKKRFIVIKHNEHNCYEVARIA